MKYSILTYIISDYEKLHEIGFNTKELTPNVEYICVTDNPNLLSKTWTIVYDEELDNNTQTPFDKVFSIRYNLFKYTNNDICVRIDGSIGIDKPLDNLVSHFIENDYDACLNIHPGRYSLISEYNAWIGFRQFPPNEAQQHLHFLMNELKYNINTKGLIEQNFSINRKSEWTDNVDKEMLSILRKLNNGQCTRLDQTIFTAYLTKKYPNKKYMFVDDYYLFSNYMTWYQHNSDNPYCVSKRNILPYFNDNVVNLYN